MLSQTLSTFISVFISKERLYSISVPSLPYLPGVPSRLGYMGYILYQDRVASNFPRQFEHPKLGGSPGMYTNLFLRTTIFKQPLTFWNTLRILGLTKTFPTFTLHLNFRMKVQDTWKIVNVQWIFRTLGLEGGIHWKMFLPLKYHLRIIPSFSEWLRPYTQSRMTWVNVPFCTIVGTFTSFNTTEVVPEIHTSHKLGTFFGRPVRILLHFMVQKPRHYLWRKNSVQYANETGLGRFLFLVIILTKIIPGNVTLHTRIKYVLENVRRRKGGLEYYSSTNRQNPNLENQGAGRSLPNLCSMQSVKNHAILVRTKNKL